MKANEFVRKHGLNSFKEAMVCPQFARHEYAIIYSDEIDFSNELIEKHADYMFKVSEIKRLIESHGLVKSRGGLDTAKHELILLQKHLNNTFGYVAIITLEKIENLKQAIADVEACKEVL
jgi:hypothetical protein